MKAFSFIVAMFLSVAVCFGQEFLYSSDYVYGSATDFDESKADSLALISFSRCIQVNVNNSSEYKLNENKNGVTEEYSKNLRINSNVNIRGARKYVENNNGIFTVYYYFNKGKYLKECLDFYNSNMWMANKYKNSNEPHAKNFILGHYYLAFSSVSEELFGQLYYGAESLKTNVLNDIIDCYNHFGYLLSARNVGKTNPSGVLLIRDENEKTIPGFEYKKDDGTWDVPRGFCDSEGEDCGYEDAKWAYIYTYVNEYRFLFETKTEYGIVKLNVPEEFYSKYLKRKVFYF